MPTVPPQIYDQDYFFGSTHGFGYVDYESDKQAMVGELRTICRLLSNRIGRTGKMLDVGAATGYFVEVASKEGWDAEGIELSKAAVQAGLGKGRKLSCGTIDEMPGENRFDALTFLDVLEHVPDPKATLKSAFRLLAPGGAVLVNVPDFGSIFARLMGKKWHSIIPPEHLWYFTRKSLGMILESIGFEHIEFRSPLKMFRFRYFTTVLSRSDNWQWLRRIQPWLEKSWLGKIIIPIPIFDNFQVIARKPASKSEVKGAGKSTKEAARRAKFFLAMATAILVSFPILKVGLAVGNSWRGVVPSIIDDDLYYYARIHEVLDGNALIGNPYFAEHRMDMSPAFFVADWISSLPFFVFSFPVSVVWNAYFWTLITALLLFTFFRRLGCSARIAVCGALLVVIASFRMLLRPTSMQTVFPVMLLFWIAFHEWWIHRTSVSAGALNQRMWKTDAWLILATSAQFYIYSYSWQVAGGTFLAGIALLAILRSWREALRLMGIGIASLLLAVPALWVMAIQIKNPWYWETMHRIGLIWTYIPTYSSLASVVWILIVFGLWFVVSRRQSIEGLTGFVLATGSGLAFAFVSNVVTGKELELYNHIIRFAIPWSIIILTILAYTLTRVEFATYKPLRRFAIFVFAVAAIRVPASALKEFPTIAFRLTPTERVAIRDVQAYAAPAAWIEAHVSTSSVIWADRNFSAFIPLLTSKYDLFDPNGGIHLVSSREMEDRYLVSRFFDPVTLDSLIADYRVYAGAGNAVHERLTRNREAQVCAWLHVWWVGIQCGKPVQSLEALKGRDFFQALADRYQVEIVPNVRQLLQTYHVSYIVVDDFRNSHWNPSAIGETQMVYNDGRFHIYKIL